MHLTSGGDVRVTMKDVAQAAGVSVTTVSHVVNDKKGARIGAEARERVLEAVDRLGYRPNALAKTLVKGRSPFIGLVADSIASTPYAGQIVQGAQEEAWRSGHILLVTNTEGNEDAEQQAISMMLQYNVRGILYSRWYHHGVRPPELLSEAPSILVNCYDEDGNLPSVVPDEFGGGRLAARELIEAGHRRIAFINTTSESPARTGRLEGYRSALAESAIDYDPELVWDVQPDQEGGFSAADRVLAERVTGVCCHNDRVAMGLYDALRERRVAVPDDVSVVGFDNQEVIAGHLHPPLSTVALPHFELGAAGVRVLLGQEAIADHGSLRIPCPVVPRASVRRLEGPRTKGAAFDPS